MALSTSVVSSPSTHGFCLLYFCFYTCTSYSRHTGVCICPCALRQTPHGHMCIGVLGSGCVYTYSVRVLRLRDTFLVSSNHALYDPTLTAAQIPQKCLRAKRATTQCDLTLTAAQIHHKCLRAKGATTTLGFTLIQIFESHTENLRIFKSKTFWGSFNKVITFNGPSFKPLYFSSLPLQAVLGIGGSH